MPSKRSTAGVLLRELTALFLWMALLLVALPVSAQTFPPDSAYTAQTCNNMPSFDPRRDMAGAMGERDIVGGGTTPAILYASDAMFLYLRMRVDDTPLRSDGTFQPFGWGFEIDTDGNRNTYEYLIMLDGIANPETVTIQRNTVVGTVGDPSDRAEVVVNTYPATTHARGTPAGGGQFFVTVAVPLSALVAAGVPLGYAVVWSGTSSSAQSLSVDLACHDGNTGAPMLGTIPVGTVAIGPSVDITAPQNGSTINTRMPTVRGIASPGTMVSVSIDGGTATMVTVDAMGNWSLTLTSPLSDGMHTVRATARNATGSMSSDTNTFTVDATPPALTITAPANGSVTNNTRPTIRGTTDPNAMVSITIDAGTAVTVTADAMGNWSLTPATALTAGMHTVRATARDAAGNTTMAMTMFTIDTTPPAVAITAPTSGATVMTGTPTITGTTEAGATIRLVIDGGAPITITPNAMGMWTFTPMATLTDGMHTVTATAVDPAGNTASAMTMFTVATGGGPMISITAPMTGASVNNSRPTIRGITSPNATVSITIDGGSAVMVTADAAGNYSFTPMTALMDGMHTARATTTDMAGRMATAMSTFRVDTVAPMVAITAPANGSTTNNRTPTIRGTSEAGASVDVSIDGGSAVTVTADAMGAWSVPITAALTDGMHSVRAVATDAAGNAATAMSSFTVDGTAPVLTITAPANGSTTTNTRPAISGTTDPNGMVSLVIDGGTPVTVTANAMGVWTFTPATALNSGPHMIAATATDAAGNMSMASGSFTIDTNALPLAIVTPASGSSTNQTMPVISGTTAPGAMLTIAIDGGAPVMVTADAMGNWTFTPTTPLMPGAHTIDVTAMDAGGRRAMQTATVTVDTTAPMVTITRPADGSRTNNNLPMISGNTEVGASVQVSIDGGPAVAATVDAAGVWSLTPGAPLSEGPHTIVVRATDRAGNAGTAMGSFTVDLTPPTLTVTTPTDGSTINNGGAAISGTTDPNGVVTLVIDGGMPVMVTANAMGVWTFTPTMALPNGMHTVVVTATDPAGNTATVTTMFTVDSTALSIAIRAPMNGSSINNTRPMISGTTDPNLMVTLVIDGGMPVTVTADAMGAWTFTPTMPLAEGAHMVTATVMMGMRTGSARTQFTIDTTAPMVTITAPMSASTSMDRTPTITGTTEPNLTVQVRIDGGMPIEVTADSMGRWMLIPTTPLADGMHTISASSSDAAGNSGMTMVTFTVMGGGCMDATSCAMTTPVCDSTSRMCRGCRMDSECGGLAPACSMTGACVQCSATMRMACDANGVGAACLTGGTCGCSSDMDCAATRRCDMATARCVPRADVDAGPDASMEAGVDASVDAAMEAGVDAAMDVAVIEAGGDGSVRTDGGADVSGDARTNFNITGNGVCGCSTPGHSNGSRGWAFFVLAAMLMGRRRRRGSC